MRNVRLRWKGTKPMWFWFFLLFLLIIFFAILPAWPYSRDWSYYPGGAIVILLLVLLFLWWLAWLPTWAYY